MMAALMLMNTACYSFVPVSTGVTPASGDYVRVKLNPDGTAAQTGTLGPRVEWAQGIVSERRVDGTLVVGVSQVRLLDGTDHFWSGQGVATLAPGHVAEVQRRSMDRGRTRIAGVAAAVGLGLIAVMTLGLGGAHGGIDAGGTPTPP
jgi:hypothetical protein